MNKKYRTARFYDVTVRESDDYIIIKFLDHIQIHYEISNNDYLTLYNNITNKMTKSKGIAFYTSIEEYLLTKFYKVRNEKIFNKTFPFCDKETYEIIIKNDRKEL